MRTFVLLVTIICLLGCAEKNKKVTDESIASNEATTKASIVSELVPVIDFEGFEPMLNTTTDTTYVVNFWATWCKPCIKELPHFEEINEKYADQLVKVLLVSLDFPEKLDPQVIPFIKEKGIKSDVVLLDDPDANSWIPKVSEQWSGAIPATIIFNKKKRKFYEQSFDLKELEYELSDFIN